MLSNFRSERSARDNFHMPPSWVAADSTFFITINCKARGRSQLIDGGVSEQLMMTVSFLHDRQRWWPEIFLLMPDHVHALISFSWQSGQGMNQVIQNWKRFTATQIGVIWQRDFFDHRIRSVQDHQQKWSYIRENPVRAGLVDQYAHWPHVWFPGRIGW